MISGKGRVDDCFGISLNVQENERTIRRVELINVE
jgi:hypothetical protein